VHACVLKISGKPDAVTPHVRFDEGGGRRRGPNLLYSTGSLFLLNFFAVFAFFAVKFSSFSSARIWLTRFLGEATI
jgi:hypothetical protein